MGIHNPMSPEIRHFVCGALIVRLGDGMFHLVAAYYGFSKLDFGRCLKLPKEHQKYIRCTTLIRTNNECLISARRGNVGRGGIEVSVKITG